MEDERWIDAVRQNPITGYITSFYAMAERMGVKERADLKSLSAITANKQVAVWVIIQHANRYKKYVGEKPRVTGARHYGGQGYQPPQSAVSDIS
ncbi:hypothetical protein E4U12_002369 [Claviceps purpurea]|nr:hypothetical protein E4U12_002369 [Claviceps purpurea]